MKKKKDLLLNRKIWSRRSSISPEFVDCSVRIYNGKSPVRCKITEGKSAGRNSSGRITVFHRGGGSKRLQRRIDLKRSTSRTNIGPGRKKGKK